MSKKDIRYPVARPIMDAIRALPIPVAIKEAPAGTYPNGWAVRIDFPLIGKGASLINHDGSGGLELLADHWDEPRTWLDADEAVELIREIAAEEPITQPEQAVAAAGAAEFTAVIEEPLDDSERGEAISAVRSLIMNSTTAFPTAAEIVDAVLQVVNEARRMPTVWVVTEHDEGEHGRIVQTWLFGTEERARAYMEELTVLRLAEAKAEAAWLNKEYDPDLEWLYASFRVTGERLNNL
jgi:hypothetical protein